MATPYLDLYLIHWPHAFQEGPELFPKDASTGDLIFSDTEFTETWKEFERAVDDGLLKSIGVSNFNRVQLERVLAIARIPPVINQVECHAYLQQRKMSAFCASKNIVLTAYSPLGSPQRPGVTSSDRVLLDDPKLKALANKHRKTVAQVLIRHQIQRGHVVIPKSVTKSRITSNIDVFAFELTDEDMKAIESCDCNGRNCLDSL